MMEYLTKRDHRLLQEVINEYRRRKSQNVPQAQPPREFRRPAPIVKNTSGETMPPYSVFRISNGGALTVDYQHPYVEAQKPSSTLGLLYGVSEYAPIGYYSEDAYGAMQIETHLLVSYDSSGTPVFGDLWGPKAGQWSLTKGGAGFRCIGIVDATDRILLAVQTPPPNDLPFRNDQTVSATSTVPDKGLMRVTGSTSDGVLTIVRTTNHEFVFDGWNLGELYAVNTTGAAVASAGFGRCRLMMGTSDGVQELLYEVGDGTPSIGESVGPEAGTWTARRGVRGWRVLSVPSSSIVKVCSPSSTRDSEYALVAANSGALTNALAAWGVGRCTLPATRKASVNARDYPTGVGYNRTQFLNGARAIDVATNTGFNETVEYAEGTLATDHGGWGLLHSAFISTYSGAIQPGCTVGLIPGTQELGAGLPGFICTRTTFDGKILVARNLSTFSWWCKATADWTILNASKRIASVTAQPCITEDPTSCYDGTDSLPTITAFTVLLPYAPGREPNIQEGNVFRYTYAAGISSGITGSQTTADKMTMSGEPNVCFGVEPYTDDAIGTVKFWVGSPGDIPQGWRSYLGSSQDMPIVGDGGPPALVTAVAGGTTTSTIALLLIERFE